MTSTGASRPPDAAPAPQGTGWTTLALIARHKRFSIAAGVIIVLMVGILVATVVGPSAGPVKDSTTCSGWGSASQSQQLAYGSLYVREHGALKDGATTPAAVAASVNTGCGQAFDNDVADSINVYQAINNQY